VLVAEDSEDLREAYVDWFVYKGVRAEQAASGPETIEKALELRPSVVVMDLSLPGSTASRWRASCAGRAHGGGPADRAHGPRGPAVEERVRACGFDAYLLQAVPAGAAARRGPRLAAR
jgi:CheY-like chemotaxis protein